MKRAEFESISVDDQLTMVSSGMANGETSYLEWFTSLHDPRLFPPLTEGFDEVLLAMHEHIQKDFLGSFHNIKTENAMDFVLILRIIGRTDTEEAGVCQPEIFAALSSLMEQGMDNEEFLINSCIVLGLFASWIDFGEEIRSVIHASGAVLQLLEIMKRYPTSSQLLIHASRALNNICYLNSASKVQFIENGGLQLLVYILKDQQFSENAKITVSLLLRNIVHLGNLRQKMLSRVKSFADDLLLLLESSLACPPVQLNLIWAALNITINLDEVKKEFGKKGGCVAIFRTMKTHKDVLDIQYACLAAILQLSTKTCNRIIFAKEGTIDEIVPYLSQYQVHPSITKMTLQALDRICSQAVGRKRLTTSKSLKNLSDFMNANQCDPKILLLSLEILYKLSVGANATRESMKKVGILPILIEAMSSNEIAIRHLAHDCMKNISSATDWDTEDSTESDSDSEDSDDSYGFGDNLGGEDFSNDSDENFDISGSDSESEDAFFEDDIKNDVESLKREKQEIEADIETYHMKIKEERDEAKKLKASFATLKKQLEKRKKHDEKSIDLMKENKVLEVTLADVRQNLERLQQKKEKHEKEITEFVDEERKRAAEADALQKEKQRREEQVRKLPKQQECEQQQKEVPIYSEVDIQGRTEEEKEKILENLDAELRRLQEIEKSLKEANSILGVIQGQVPRFQSTLANFEGMAMY